MKWGGVQEELSGKENDKNTMYKLQLNVTKKKKESPMLVRKV